jgi:aspartyl protease
MPNIVQIPITNIYMGGDYTGRILVGANKQPMNVILDTGSSALALDGHKYTPGAGDKTTRIAQWDGYGDSSNSNSWTGAVIQTTVAAGSGANSVTLTGANASVTYEETANMFGSADGILGLAYAPLDDAFEMAKDTWQTRYPATEVRQGSRTGIAPYLTQLAGENIVSDKVSFLTRRSYIHSATADPATDPLNQGVMIIGGGEESTDLYTGQFQTVKVLADEWYNTNLKEVIVGNTTPLQVHSRGPTGMPSNSIVDSGTNSLNLSPQLLKALVSKFNAVQQSQLIASISEGRTISMSDLNLPGWPDLTFVLQGETGDVSLTVKAGDYWQVNAPKAGAAMAAITVGDAGLAILGLPLMNGYFTIFDGEADGGKGAIKFAARKD